MVEALNGCRVFYEVGAHALVVSPEGEWFRVSVGGQEVSLTLLPPMVDLESIAARRRSLNLQDRVTIWSDGRSSG
jgi:hypothetical protein